MTKDDKKQSIFGLFDSLTSMLGIILALAITGNYKSLVIASIAGAVGAAGSMAGGEWLSDKEMSLHRASVMGIATFVGGILPALPFFIVANLIGLIVSILIAIILGIIISYLRPEDFRTSFKQTFRLLIPVTALALFVSLLAGAIVS
jgi:VIT1/CCC1 family predicted Fe2+/Mn2+ transporter